MDERGDRSLLDRCLLGDPTAWPELVRGHARLVRAVAMRGYGLREHDAEDVFQEAFARTFEHLDRVHSDAALKPWLAQVTRNLAVDRLRRLAREAPTEPDAMPVVLAEDRHAALDTSLALEAALGRLPEPSREVVWRFFLEDQPQSRIAEELELAPGTVASRVSQALDRLRHELDGAVAAR